MGQKTIKHQASMSGTGLHSGRKVNMTFKPAKEDSGITFRRTDITGSAPIKADIGHVKSTVRGTNIGEISTVEHVMSALYGLEITNLEIELDGPEPPALDGSSVQYCELLLKAGLASQRAQRNTIKLSKPVIVQDKDRAIVALPGNRFTISFMIDYHVCFIGFQYLEHKFSSESYKKEIAPARTYGFIDEVAALKEKGLALGATAENAIAIGKDRYLNELRFRDELVRHKILDLIGDLSLIGAEIKAHIICIRSGHDLNISLAKKLKEVG